MKAQSKTLDGFTVPAAVNSLQEYREICELNLALAEKWGSQRLASEIKLELNRLDAAGIAAQSRKHSDAKHQNQL